MNCFIIILVHFFISSISAITIPEIKVYFGYKSCIAGSLTKLMQEDSLEPNTMPAEPELLYKIDILENIQTTENGKSAMSFVNELAQYNGISYSYELIKEEGPPHSKLFTIKLYLGDEEYTGEEMSLKKAQQAAATMALQNSNYEHPPVKIKENEKSLTPTVLLNNLAAKLGLALSYHDVTNDILDDLENNPKELELGPKKSYLQKLNDTVHSNDTIHVRKDGSDSKGPFKVRVNVNGQKFIGEAHTKQNAKHEAALKALKALKEQESNFYCLKESDNCKSNKQAVKSPISLVYELAQNRNMPVTFEVIDEVGPSHKKIFTTKCSAGDLESTGEGKSKKESKRASAENMLPMLQQIPEVEGVHKNINENNNKKSKKKNKKNKIIKTTFDKIDRMLDNVVDFGKGLIDKIKGDSDDKDSKSFSNNKGQKRSPTDEIMQLGKILNLELQFNDLADDSKSYSLLDLGTKPSFICLGEGVNKKNSRDLAARHGINTLYKMGLLDNLLDKTMKISNILDKEEAYQNLWLEVINEDKKE